MARGFFDLGQDKLLSPSAIDAAGAAKPIGPAADQSVINRTLAALTKLSLAIRTRKGRLREVYDAADSDGNGDLDEEEFIRMCFKFMPGQISRAEALQMMKLMDTDGSGKISFKEFSEGVLQHQKRRGPVTVTMNVVPKEKKYADDLAQRNAILYGSPLNR